MEILENDDFPIKLFKYNIILRKTIPYKTWYTICCHVKQLKFHVFGSDILIKIVLCSWNFSRKS